MDLEAYLGERRDRFDRALERLLPEADGPASTVIEAMRYAIMGGGKRLRPILVLASCEACGGDSDAVIPAAAAVEMIHTYSLVHDDLPAMDDDDLRRGRPTVHRRFGEAAAVLAGDGLLTLAFELLGTHPAGPEAAPSRTAAVVAVAGAAGIAGMVGGQIADLEAEREPSALEHLEWIHRHKTGALLAVSCELGAIHAGADLDLRSRMNRYGQALGLAFQITDDILDETATVEALGKTPGKDVKAGKATYPALFGIEKSREEARRLVDEAIAELDVLGTRADLLARLARYVVTRSA